MNLVQKICAHSSKVKKAIHVGYWLVYMLCIWLITSQTERDLWDYTFGNYLLWIVVSMPFKWAIFYSYYYYFIPQWFPRRAWKFTGLTVFLLIAYPLIKYGIDSLLGLQSLPTIVISFEDNEPEYLRVIIEYFRRFSTPFMLVSMAFLIRFVLDWFRHIRLQEKMEKERLTSELALLRNQVNPHFLFNVLNNIDTLVYPHSKEASDAIMKLSAIMRYMLYDTNVEKVPLSKEIAYLKAYIELQTMRLKDPSGIRFDTSRVGDTDLLITPMVLVPFVENAFKHGAALNGGPKIAIAISVEDHQLLFTVKNNVSSTHDKQKDEVGGIGLKNVSRRLELLYPDKHNLQIHNGADQFEVELKLDITP